ncbi:protein serine/threonine kinase, putative [Entamoeba dispar SAW760]|uniref:Protein serine/threonine kinase, putative n=1 Tax=Entamoeba dispar (strain ATCC PRA-260 / SAW760) TaxID=370354 RepID=B0EHX4_ENTDS|nr:protein serine/threonine kinase, putative [Entamoeba dispar SAW760]EDR25918.1 protein serine/threonine kinase, putative [Entamoeba dispar SAW760]|eukprot:EDR25918.1 protein serine/threonine kinase, putative [Entamoeba dispar SAW760]
MCLISILLILMSHTYGSCDLNCIKCERNICTLCDDGFTLDNEGSCAQCLDYCKICSSASILTCNSCFPNYYLKDNSCIPCSNKSNCQTCSTNSSECLVCEDGYYLNEGECLSCSLKACKLCNSMTGECSSCLPGYYLDRDSCIECSNKENCKTCSTDSNKCLVCEDGYYPNEGECLSCSSKNCGDDCNTSDGTCTTCINNCYPENGICKECSTLDSNCQSCSAKSGVCLKCQIGFNLASDQTKCVKCENNIGCEICDPTSEKCGACKDRYYLDPSSHLCGSCSSHCMKCVSSSKCISCEDSYILYQGSCVQKECDTTTTENIDITCGENCNSLITDKPKCSHINTPAETCDKSKQRLNDEECILCKDGYLLNSNSCIELSNYVQCNREVCFTKEGFYQDVSSKEIKSCLNEFEVGSTSFCRIYKEKVYPLKCSDKYYYLNRYSDSVQCVSSIPNCKKYIGNECVECESHYYIEGGICSPCSEECLECEGSANTCISCDTTKRYKTNQTCKLRTVNGVDICERVDVNLTTCKICGENYYLSDTGECIETVVPNCAKQVGTDCEKCVRSFVKKNNQCIKCDGSVTNGLCYYPVGLKSNIKTEIENSCMVRNEIGCVRCQTGYYLDSTTTTCRACKEECSSCTSLNQCSSCKPGYYLSNGDCVSSSGNCNRFIIGNTQSCLECKEGYYRNSSLMCDVCPEGCRCVKPDFCTSCFTGYFKTPDMLWCESTISLTHCTNITVEGCTECEEGTYLSNGRCKKCGIGCKTCKESGDDSCTSCKEGFIRSSESKIFSCTYYTNVSNCLQEENEHCVLCSRRYKLSDNRLKCEEKSMTGIITVFAVSCILVLLIIIIMTQLIGLSCIEISRRKHNSKVECKTVCIFKMKYSNLKFSLINEKPSIVTNKSIIRFDLDNEVLPVGKESRDLVCIGNNGNNKIKIQTTLKESNDKYLLEIQPPLVVLDGGYACEFEIFITPYCTTRIEDKLSILSFDMKEGIETLSSIIIRTETEISTRLDYDELIQEKKIGEGSFGVVFKGTYRGRIVAIKKIKESQSTEKALIEFEKEATMLDKFRSDYIVHFYGAIFIPNKICLVTEYADYGSLRDLIEKKSHNFVSHHLRLKILLDASKGIQYLHENEMLHRDIKPDNVLVLSLDDNITINAKLTDFGSSRNVNLLMTNMTFTKGVGTPSYMAPEILNRLKYKMPADIYSFGMTMYSVLNWSEPFPKQSFKFAWDVAEFIESGNHLPQYNIKDEEYALIMRCWENNPKSREIIQNVVKDLESLVINSNNI